VPHADDRSRRFALAEAATIARLAFPIALAQFGMVALGLVEIAILGRATPEQLGGASIGRSLGFVGMGLGIGASAGLEPLAAQAVGAREPATAWRAFTATIAAGALLALPCGALEIASTWALEPLGVEPALIPPARAFVIGHAPGLFFVTVFLAAKTYLQAHKRTAPAVVGAVTANVANLAVCSLLVLGDGALVRLGLPRAGLPALGAFGAGLANTFANAVLAACVFVPAWRSRPRALSPEESARARVPIAKVLGLGVPIGLQLLAEIGVFSLVAVLAGRLGTVAVSAHQIAIGLASFTFMGVLGVSAATSVRVGHAIGERRSPRPAGLIGIAMGAAFMGCCGIVFLSAPRALVAAFTDDPAIVDLGARLVLIAAAFQLFDGVQGVAAGALRGAADVRFPFVVIAGAHWLIGFPLALYFGFHAGLGAPGLWWGLLVGLALVAALLTWRFVAISGRAIDRA
jgi:MATE family multidrug resistance protein